MRVACPWFEPVDRAVLTDRPQPARSPLGLLYSGFCHAGSVPVRPPDAILHEECNFGYGRGRCPWFPASSEADAVRFAWRSERLMWILEREYAPVAHGFCDEGTRGAEMDRQAAAFRSGCPR